MTVLCANRLPPVCAVPVTMTVTMSMAAPQLDIHHTRCVVGRRCVNHARRRIVDDGWRVIGRFVVHRRGNEHRQADRDTDRYAACVCR